MAGGAAEHLGEITGEGLIRAGWMARHLLDVICSEVTVAFAESRRVLAEGIGEPLRQSHVHHSFSGGLEGDVDVLDLLTEDFRKPGGHVVK